MGYIPPAFLASEEFVGGIIPLKIPPTLKYSTIWRNFVCGGKNSAKKFPTLNISSLTALVNCVEHVGGLQLYLDRRCPRLFPRAKEEPLQFPQILIFGTHPVVQQECRVYCS